MMFWDIVYLLLSIVGAIALLGVIGVLSGKTIKQVPQFLAEVLALEVKSAAGRINLLTICLLSFVIILESASSLFVAISTALQGQPPQKSEVLTMYICLSLTALFSLIVVALLERRGTRRG